MVRHRVEAFRIAPEGLHDWMNVPWQFSHFANQPLQRSCGGRTKDPDKLSRHAWCATGQKRHARANEADMRKQRADARQLSATPKHPGTLRRRCEPLGGGIDENETGNSCPVPHGIGGHNETPERVAKEDVLLARRNGCENCCQFVDDRVECPRTRRRFAPGEACAIVRTDASELRDSWLHDSPTERRGGDAGLEQDGRAAAAETSRVQAVSADIDQYARRSEPSALPPAGDPLSDYSQCQQYRQRANNTHSMIVARDRAERNLEHTNQEKSSPS